MSMEFLFGLVLQLLTAGAIYGGIRADIKQLHSSVARAHERLDNHLDKGDRK